MRVKEVPIGEVRPYERNPRLNDGAVQAVAESLKEFGWRQPIVVDADGTIVAGHTRYKAAQALGMQTVPVTVASDLTPEQVQAYRLADNKVGELADWDVDLLAGELDGICDIDMEGFGFTDADLMTSFERGMARAGDMADSEEYSEFIDKFEAKKTTDDCYTPAEVYDAVLSWARGEYGLGDRRVVRPFYPGGDYRAESYPDGCVVVDNPPFSILSEIVGFYLERGVDFFLFSPCLTNMGVGAGDPRVCHVLTDVTVTYANGARVNTSFLTSLEPGCVVRSAPELQRAVCEADDANVRGGRPPVERVEYSYPDEVVTSTMVGYLSKYGVEWRVGPGSVSFTRALDSQAEAGKGIFGSGFLLPEKAAAEKAAAEKAAAEKAKNKKDGSPRVVEWSLSDREREIVAGLA